MKTIIGIDPGVNTGIAYISDCREERNQYCKAVKIHEAMDIVRGFCGGIDKVFVRVEDARKRKWFGKNSQAKQQGAGSIKRDSKIWEDFLTDLEKEYPRTSFEMCHPIKNGTKIDAKLFGKITGIKSSTNEHGRDAFMLIHGLKF